MIAIQDDICFTFINIDTLATPTSIFLMFVFQHQGRELYLFNGDMEKLLP